MLHYLHHMFFDPVSAAEQFTFSILMFPILAVIAFGARLILYWIYGEDDE